MLIFQAWIFKRQANISDKQATLAHQTYLTSNRPRLRIRNVVVYRTLGGSQNENALLFEDDHIVGQCFVSNIGGATAYINESHLIVFASQMGLPMARPYEGADPNRPIGPIAIYAGASHPILFREINPLVTGTTEPESARGGGHPFYIMGWISYGDDNGTSRRTAFCRRWDSTMRRFVRLDDDPDYEHEE